MADISRFSGAHFFLSNFATSPLTFRGLRVNSAEAAFQSFKARDEPMRRQIASSSPKIAKELGQAWHPPGWHSGGNISTMKEVLAVKFAPGSELARQLLATGRRRLIEGNSWNDTFCA